MDINIKYFIYFLLGIITFYLLFNEQVEGIEDIKCEGTVGVGRFKDKECSGAFEEIKNETTFEDALSWCAGEWQKRTDGCELKGEPQCIGEFNEESCADEHSRIISEDNRRKANEWCVAQNGCELGPPLLDQEEDIPSNSSDVPSNSSVVVPANSNPESAPNVMSESVANSIPGSAPNAMPESEPNMMPELAPPNPNSVSVSSNTVQVSRTPNTNIDLESGEKNPSIVFNITTSPQ